MVAEVLSHHQVAATKPEDATRSDAEAQSATKRSYVPIRPAYRPLLPKPSTRDSTPSPIHIHTRTSGLSQLACRKRHSGVTAKIDAVKRRRSLATRASEQARTAAAPDAKADVKPSISSSASATASSTASAAGSSHGSPSPSASSVPSPPAMDSPSVTSVSTRSIFGPPPSQSIDALDAGAAAAAAGFDLDAQKPRGVAGNMTLMMSALVNRFQPTQAPGAGADSGAGSPVAAVDDAESAPPFSLPLNEYDDMPLENLDLDQFNKLDMDLEPSISPSSSAAASLASSVASGTSLSATASDPLAIPTAMSEDVKKMSSQSPEAFTAYGSPSADFDDFTDLYFHAGTQFDSVTPTDGSPDTLGDVLENEVGLVDKAGPDGLSMMDFLAPVDLFNA